jgi:hypothetical protein
MNASHAKPDEMNDIQVRAEHVHPEGITSKSITSVFARGRPRDDRANYPNFEAQASRVQGFRLGTALDRKCLKPLDG